MGLPETSWLMLLGAALVAVTALVSYSLGHSRPRYQRCSRTQNRPEIERALSVAGDLEGVSQRLRKALSRHRSAVRKFLSRLVHFEHQPAVSRHDLCDRSEEMLKPANRLIAEISNAYAQLLQQMAHLSAFAELRTDPLTGVANRQALEETLATLLSEQTRSSEPISLAMVDIDFFKQLNESRTLLQGDRVLTDLVEILRATVRQCDLLARYGGEEFLIVLPHTELSVAANLAERVRAAVQEKMPITVSIGLAASAHGDTTSTLFGRAEAALALAKSAGRNCVYLHEGTMGRIVGLKTSPGNNSTAPRPATPPSAAKTTPLSAKTVELVRKFASPEATATHAAEPTAEACSSVTR